MLEWPITYLHWLITAAHRAVFLSVQPTGTEALHLLAWAVVSLILAATVIKR